PGQQGRPRGALARSAVRARARTDRRLAPLRAPDQPARSPLWPRHRLPLPGPGPPARQAVQAVRAVGVTCPSPQPRVSPTRPYITSVRITYLVPAETGRPSCRSSWRKTRAMPRLGVMTDFITAVSPPVESSFKYMMKESWLTSPLDRRNGASECQAK